MIPPTLFRRVLPIAALVLVWAGWVAAQVATPGQPATPPAAGPQPEIRFDALTHDFGVVEDGVTLKHLFQFRNVGQALLIIDRVKAG